MAMYKDNGVEFLECGGCGRTFDPENEFEIKEAETHNCDDEQGFECARCGDWIDEGEEHPEIGCDL